jgi:membrane-anchored protein YejM (alkaline phosphatase superfamily)
MIPVDTRTLECVGVIPSVDGEQASMLIVDAVCFSRIEFHLREVLLFLPPDEDHLFRKDKLIELFLRN